MKEAIKLREKEKAQAESEVLLRNKSVSSTILTFSCLFLVLLYADAFVQIY